MSSTLTWAHLMNLSMKIIKVKNDIIKISNGENSLVEKKPTFLGQYAFFNVIKNKVIVNVKVQLSNY